LFESSGFCFEDVNKNPKTTTKTTFRTKTLLFLTNIIYYCTSRPLRNNFEFVTYQKILNFNLSLFKFFVSTDVYLIWRKPVCHFYLLLISQNSGKMGKLIFERTNASCSKDNLLFLEFIMLFGRVILISEIKMKETHLFVSFSFHHLFVI
jgi:hypothetical protein